MQGTLDLSRAPARCVDHLVRDQAARRRCGPHGAARAPMSAPTAGSRTCEPTPASSVTAGETPPAGEPGPLVARADDTGFIHAPSMTHAAAAALLRNAHLGPDRHAAAGRPVRDRSVVAARARGGAAARRRAPGAAARRAARLPVRAPAARHRARHDRYIAPMRELAPLTARPARERRPAAARRSRRTTWSTGWCWIARSGRDSHTQRGCDQPRLSPRHASSTTMRPARRDRRELDALGRRDRRGERRAHRRSRLPDGRAATRRALASTLDGHRARRRAAAGAGGARTPRTGTAMTHRLHGAVERTRRSIRPAGSRADRRRAPAPSRCSTPGPRSCSATAPRSAARSSGSTTRPAPWSRRARSRLSELAVAPLDIVYGVEAETSATQPATR